MGAHGFEAAEEGHVVHLLSPKDTAGGTDNSDVFSLRNYRHATIIVAFGALATAPTITVEECDDFTPTNSTAIPFASYVAQGAAAAANGDVLGARVQNTASGLALLATDDDKFVVIEIDASELSDGFPNLRVVLTAAAGANFASIVAVLSGARHAEPQSPTEIA